MIRDDPGASKKHVISQVKAKVNAMDTAARLAHTNSLQVQGLTVQEFLGHVAQNWSKATSSLLEWHFKFALNSVTDTLPHNANLFKWKKLSSSKCQLCGEHQSLAHVLNAWQKALSLRRYSARHDDVLQVIMDFASRLLPEGMHITADLPGMHYSFPQDITTTDL